MPAPVYHYQSVSSTMDVIHQLAEEGAPAGTIVVAAEQLQGRGSRGRAWHSPLGGLWLSALFRPESVSGMEVLSVRVGLAIARALDGMAPVPVGLKWPNDLILAGRKLGGILGEARWQGEVPGWIAVGIGLNVRNPISSELRSGAIALAELIPGIQVDQVLEIAAPAIRSLDLAQERLSPDELEQFASRSWLTGREIRRPFAGVVTGLDQDGALQVRTAQGSQVSLRHGSVELAGTSQGT